MYKIYVRNVRMKLQNGYKINIFNKRIYIVREIWERYRAYLGAYFSSKRTDGSYMLVIVSQTNGFRETADLYVNKDKLQKIKDICSATISSVASKK